MIYRYKNIRPLLVCLNAIITWAALVCPNQGVQDVPIEMDKLEI